MDDFVGMLRFIWVLPARMRDAIKIDLVCGIAGKASRVSSPLCFSAPRIARVVIAQRGVILRRMQSMKICCTVRYIIRNVGNRKTQHLHADRGLELARVAGDDFFVGVL